MFCVMTPWRNLGASGPERVMRRREEERETRPDDGGAADGRFKSVGEDENFRRGAACVRQLAHTNPLDVEDLMVLDKILLEGRMFVSREKDRLANEGGQRVV